MTKKQIEKKAKEIANKYPEVGYNSKYHREIYAAAMEMGDWALSHQWVRVEDELPPKKNRSDYSDRVIISTEHLIISASCYDYNKHRWLCGYAVTHWMPIPPLAEEGGEDEHVGQSEDLYDYLHGRDSEIDIEEQRRQEEAYYQEMYNRHEQEMQQMFDALAEE